MRLIQSDINIIISAFNRYLGSGKLFLFGSMLDDQKKGGDVDLYVEYDKNISFKDIYSKITDMRCSLYEPLSNYRGVDIVFTYPGKKEGPIDNVARKGILITAV